MKIKNALLVIMSFVATAIAIVFFVGARTGSIDDDTLTNLIFAYFITFVVIWVYAFISGVVSLVFSISSKKPANAKNALIAKILMIPFFLVNFAIWFLLIFGFSMISFIPVPGAFLFGIPAIILGCLSVTGTYVIMISTSVDVIVPFVKKVFKKEAEPAGIVGTILLFIFCLDIVGAGILTLCTKKNNNNSQQLKFQA